MKGKRKKLLGEALRKHRANAVEVARASTSRQLSQDSSYLDPTVKRAYPIVKAEEPTLRVADSSPYEKSSCELAPTPPSSASSE